MAKSKSFRFKNRKKPEPVNSATQPVTDRTLWYSSMTSLDPSLKNEVWAAQALFFMKRSGGSKLFLDPDKAAAYRKTDRLDPHDPQQYKKMFDPITPMGQGGTAQYVSADFKLNPIYIHLKNIVKAEIENTGKQIEVSLTDKFAKTRQMQDNYRILYQREFRKLVNHLAKEIGIPGISENQDPYKFVQNMFRDDTEQSPDMVDKYVDLIKNQITDSQDLALYNELIYKGDYEMAFELGIKYYLFNLNKWNDRWADEVLNDLMHFNKFAGEWYTDLITGRPVIERFSPEALWTSPFRRKDGEDIMYYWTEYTITFGDFVRTMGKNLSPARLKEVFELMKQQSVHNIDWQDSFFDFGATVYTRDSALVRIGRAAFLSTDMDVQAENIYTGQVRQVPITWEATENERRVEKRYNVWRWWYYIPPTTGGTFSANWQWQSNFIFELQKFQDQQRFGDNGRYAKSPLVIYDNSSQASFTDIVQAFMPKITHLWHRYQNYIVNDIDAQILSDDFLGGMLSAIDEENNVSVTSKENPVGGNGINPYLEQWRMIKQGGTGFLRMRDKNNQPILDPSKLVVSIKNNYLEKAEGTLTQMLILYETMIKSLAFSPMTAGEEVKPRTPVAALEQTLKSTNRARFFIQKAYESVICQYGERIVRYIIDIANEVDKYKFPYRWDEFMENVGYANGLAIEGMKEIDPECVGMTINYVDNTAMKEFVMQMAIEYSKTKELNEEFLYLLMGVDNWKYAFVLMRMAMRKRRSELQEEAAMAHQRAMELKQADLAIAIKLQQAKDAGKDQNIVTEGQVEMMINEKLNEGKYISQSQLKKETDALREKENAQKNELDKDKETHKKNLEMQAPIV